MTINFDDNDKIIKNVKTQIRQMYEISHTDVKEIKVKFVSNDNSDSERDLTEIMGGRFDGKIGCTMQSYETGDCWILADVNALNTTDWGKDIIKNAIKPHKTDGVIVTLEGAKGYNKEFHITKKDFEEAHKNEKYSIGDDDMLAIELAVEKYIKALIEAGKIDENPDKAITGSMNFSAAELLTNAKTHRFFYNDIYLEGMINKISENPSKYTSTCSFRENNEHIYKNHAYTLKEIQEDTNGDKSVIMINPWDSSQEIEISYNDFIQNLDALSVTENPKDKDKSLKSMYDIKSENIHNKMCHIIAKNINSGLLNDDYERVLSSMNKFSKDNVITLLENKYMDNIIGRLDDFKSGFGNGKEKKNLILPVINSLAEKAEEEGVDKNAVENFKKVCINQELDATFYTNSSKITKEIEKILRLIKEKE